MNGFTTATVRNMTFNGNQALGTEGKLGWSCARVDSLASMRHLSQPCLES